MGVTKLTTNGFTGLQKYDSFLAGNGPVLGGAFQSIATTTVGSGGSASITFSSIPSTFTHLQVRGILRSSNAVTVDQTMLQVNGSTASSSYAFHQILGDGTNALSYGYTTGTLGGIAPLARQPGTSATAGIFGTFVLDILNYTSTNMYKTVRAFIGYDSNGSGYVGLTSGLYLLNTNAVSSLTILIQGGGNYAQYSTAALYGVS